MRDGVTNLDVIMPDEVAKVLRNAAHLYVERANDLRERMSLAEAAKVWDDMGQVMMTAAENVEKILNEW
jgi:uncharacterized protein YbaP (TraB family)